MHCARAASDDCENIAEARARERSHDSNAAREERKWPLEFFIKQSFGSEAVAHLLESHAQSARTHRVERLNYQLVLAARLIYRKSPAHANLQAVRRAKAYAPVYAAKTFRVQLRPFILDCEVPVSRLSYLEV